MTPPRDDHHDAHDVGVDTTGDDPSSSSSLAPFRFRSFRRLWAALMVFSLGHLILVVGSSWLILEMTGSPLWVSAMVGAPTLPLLLLSLPAGAAADLFDRRLILSLSTLVLIASSATMAALAALDAITPLWLVTLGLAIGIGVAFFNPTWHAIVPSLVPSSLVPGAVSLNSVTGGVATAIGPAIGGLLVGVAGPQWAFGGAAVGYAVLLAVIVTTPTADLDQETGSLVIAIATGIRYLRFSRDYLWLLLLGSLFGFSSAALRSMLPNLTNDVLGGTSRMYGVLLGLFGAGAMIGGLSRSIVSRRLSTHLIPVCIVAFGGMGVVVGLSTAVPLTAVVITIAGVLWTLILATLSSTYQMLTPDWVRGRTMGAFVLSLFGFVPLGSLAAGALGDSIGAADSLLVFSLAVIVIGAFAFRMPLPVLEQITPPILPDLGRRRDDLGGSVDPVMVITTWTIEDDHHDEFVEVLSDLRLIRLRTGAHQWTAYRNADDPSEISEVFLVRTWDQHMQQLRRLDIDAHATIRRANGFGSSETRVTRQLIAFDLADVVPPSPLPSPSGHVE